MDLKFLGYLFDVLYTLVVYTSYKMGNQDLPDTVYGNTFGPAALGLGQIYQANPSFSCYNSYMHTVFDFASCSVYHSVRCH